MLAMASWVFQQPFYVWLLSIYPILHLYAENLGLVKDGEVLHVCGAVLAATTLAFLVANRFIRCRNKTGFMLSVCSLFFSLSGHVYALVFLSGSILLWSLLVLIAMTFTLVKLWRLESSKYIASVTPALNLTVLALLAIPIVNLVPSIVSTPSNLASVSALGNPSAAQDATPKVYDSGSRPDIYYIIPDGYPSDSWLQEAMNYDNSAFTEALEERGFIVADRAQSNYPGTLLSLASILNMKHYGVNPSVYADYDYLRLLIADSAVARLLLHYGYTYVQILSGYLIPSPIADINRDFTPSGALDIEVGDDMLPTVKLQGMQHPKNMQSTDLRHFYKRSFISLYINTTLFRIVEPELTTLFWRDESAPYDLFAPERFLETIDEVATIASMPEATFTMVHFLKPHRPVVFDRHGNLLVDRIPSPSHAEYFAEFAFTNAKYLELIDEILAESENEPVIIFQADHGSTYGSVGTIDEKLTHFDVYSAYYAPDPHRIQIPRPFTLINTFPLVLNSILDTELELQDNRLLEMLAHNKPFILRNVTKSFLKS